jgi:hypothetical protein
MRRATVNLTFCAAVLGSLFSLYSVFSFWSIQDISTPQPLPRMRYDLYCWAAIFAVCTIIGIALAVYRNRFRPKKE